MWFQIDDKSIQAAKCVKCIITTKVIDYVPSINKFEQQCVMLKGMLQSPRLKDHMKTIGVDQALINSDLFEQRFLQNINRLYKHDGKCDNQQQLKDIIEAAMVSNPGGFSNNSIRYTMTQ